MTTSTDYHKTRYLAMTADERAEYDAATAQADLALDIAQAVYDARTEAGMTQAQLAAAMGVTQSYISGLEGGGTVPNVKTLARVATAVGKRLHVEFAA